MRKFEIIPIAMTLKNNQIGKSGEVVEETQLNTNAQELISTGFIREIFSEKESEKDEDPIDGMTVEELKQLAKDNDFDIEGVTKKADIVKAIKEQMKK